MEDERSESLEEAAKKKSRGLKTAPNNPRVKPGTAGPAARTVGRDGPIAKQGYRSGPAYDH